MFVCCCDNLRRQESKMQSFSELSISPSLKERLKAARFSVPTPVQAAAIPQALAGKDVIATAQTGTGKTLAFLVPVIEKLFGQNAPGITALVLVPTRELAMQVVAQANALQGKQAPPAALVVGGLPEGRQLDTIHNGARLVVATPGRLEDYLDRRLISLRGVKTLVLDEADRMLDMGFLPAIRRIASVLPKERQTLCFSATMEGAVSRLVSDYTRSPVRLAFGSTLKPSENVRLQAFAVAENVIHRVGRTGRGGSRGVASTLFVREQRTEFFQLERALGIQIERVSMNGESFGKRARVRRPGVERIAATSGPRMVRLPGEFLQAQMES